jgi:hypothetical protein
MARMMRKSNRMRSTSDAALTNASVGHLASGSPRKQEPVFARFRLTPTATLDGTGKSVSAGLRALACGGCRSAVIDWWPTDGCTFVASCRDGSVVQELLGEQLDRGKLESAVTGESFA